MNKYITFDNTKYVTKIVVGTSVKMVIATAITSYIPTESKTDKVKVFVGTMVLSHMVADATKTWTDTKMDALAESYHDVKNKIAQAQKS